MTREEVREYVAWERRQEDLGHAVEDIQVFTQVMLADTWAAIAEAGGRVTRKATDSFCAAMANYRQEQERILKAIELGADPEAVGWYGYEDTHHRMASIYADYVKACVTESRPWQPPQQMQFPFMDEPP